MRFEAHREKGFSFAFNVPRAIHGSMDPWHGVEVEVDGEGECTAYVCIIDIQGRNAEKA